jgi:hypothetical protein
MQFAGGIAAIALSSVALVMPVMKDQAPPDLRYFKQAPK